MNRGPLLHLSIALLRRFAPQAVTVSSTPVKDRAMKNNHPNSTLAKLVTKGFIAGFLSTITFHQFVLWLLWFAGITPARPYVLTPVPPWGIPFAISLALWGGVWGLLFCLTLSNIQSEGYWLKSFGFGAVFPTLVALFIVFPLKGRPLGGGWHWPILMTALLVNGAWGVGTALYFKVLFSGSRQAEVDSTACTYGETRSR